MSNCFPPDRNKSHRDRRLRWLCDIETGHMALEAHIMCCTNKMVPPEVVGIKHPPVRRPWVRRIVIGYYFGPVSSWRENAAERMLSHLKYHPATMHPSQHLILLCSLLVSIVQIHHDQGQALQGRFHLRLQDRQARPRQVQLRRHRHLHRQEA